MLVRAVVATVALASAPGALAHGPSTSIGRAVEALRTASVSYEPGAAVSDVEAGGFPLIADSNPKVAFMAETAATELAGGPDAIAAEVAREARLDGTLVVLVGTKLGAWSDEIGGERLDELVRDAQAVDGSPAAAVEALIRAVQEEPTGRTPWTVVGIAVPVVAAAAFVAYHRLGRRKRAATE